MGDLTSKQQANLIDYVMGRKISALRMICRHIGMLPLTAARIEANRAKISDDMLLWALLGLTNETAWKRLAAILLLDLVSDDWRTVAGDEIMGINVDRDAPEVRRWRSQVIANDGGACRHCGSTDRLHAHHIVRWADDPAQRLVISNGMTLCEACHVEEHRRYG